MTETVSNVYDLTYASPITLKEISSIVVVVELWRKKIRAQSKSKLLQEFYLQNDIRLRTVLPNLPSKIYTSLEKYLDTFRKSVVEWHKFHHHHVFNDSGSINFLHRFDDFAWDWDGTILGSRTAKRMMLCDRLTKNEKFKIACLYCFEDDIKHLWSSVRKTKGLNKIDFETRPELYYWKCYLRNELHKIPNPDNYPIDVLMVIKSGDLGRWEIGRNPYSVMYFWNRLPSNTQLPEYIYVRFNWPVLFARFILPKLNEHQLDIFVAAKGADLMRNLLIFQAEPTLHCVVPTWMYIRSRIDTRNFSCLINGLLEDEAICGAHFDSRGVSETSLSIEIWNNAPQHFKRSVFDDVLNNDRLFDINNMRIWTSKGRKLLITVLQDAAFQVRNAFWHKNWRNLISSAPVEDLVVIMKLSFQNENEVELFKENIMSIDENIVEGCALLLKHSLFGAINDFLSFCYLDEQKRKEVKRRLLRSNYTGENSVLTMEVVIMNKSLKKFIDNAFQDAADLGVEFRTQLTSSPVTRNCLLECTRNGFYDYVMEFVDSFFADEQILVHLKKRLFEHFKEHFNSDITCYVYINGYILNKFLLWLLGSEVEVGKFKQSIPVEDIFRGIMQADQRAMANDGYCFKPEFPARLDAFLMWYFNKDEKKINKFTKLFLDELKSFRPRKRKRIV